MATTGFEPVAEGGEIRGMHGKEEKHKFDETPMAYGVDDEANPRYSSGDSNEFKPVFDSTHRKLKPRHIQLIGIGGYAGFQTFITGIG